MFEDNITVSVFSPFSAQETKEQKDKSRVYMNRLDDSIPIAQDIQDKVKLARYYKEKAMDYFDTDDLTDALVKTCLQMRRAEFVHEGLRWFDILRYELPVTHRKNTGEEFVLNEDDLRKVLQLPSEVTLSGLELNPR